MVKWAPPMLSGTGGYEDYRKDPILLGGHSTIARPVHITMRGVRCTIGIFTRFI